MRTLNGLVHCWSPCPQAVKVINPPAGSFHPRRIWFKASEPAQLIHLFAGACTPKSFCLLSEAGDLKRPAPRQQFIQALTSREAVLKAPASSHKGCKAPSPKRCVSLLSQIQPRQKSTGPH